ncbi:transporter substrate-binding domain-containing protein [Neisseria sp. Ec49-e6-T10]|uniref:transporter substrate-binding domain-containing protein n=1 Tax=Neisseria sp. Ec49-e6-T10 TaxID=3140744 RepID=UPI003EBF4E02
MSNLVKFFYIGLLGIVMSACSPQKQDNNSVSNADGSTVIKVGTEGTYDPFSYKNEKGELTGFDIEVLKEVAKREPSIKFEFIASPWDTLFPGLDADKFQMLANQITATPERQQRYHLTEQSYFNAVSQIAVKEGNPENIKTLEDLKGKKVGMGAGSNHTRFVEDWNNAHGKILNIVYYDGNLDVMLQDIANGRIVATINDPIAIKGKAKAQNLKIDIVGDFLTKEPAKFIFKKDEKGLALQQKIDAVLNKMKEDGTLTKMSVEQFGQDYTK